MDLLLEDFENFPEVWELGKDSARFIWQKMESTWGQSHLAVLAEDKAQWWLLGVSTISYIWRPNSWSLLNWKPHHKNMTTVSKGHLSLDINICLTSVTHAKCGIHSTLCWKVGNISFWVVILDYGLKLHKLSIYTLVMLQKWLEIHQIIVWSLHCILFPAIFATEKFQKKNFNTLIKIKLLVSKTSDSCFQGFDFFQMLLACYKY